MYIRPSVLLCSALALVHLSCSKNDEQSDDQSGSPTPNNLFDPTVMMATDANGDPVGTTDTTDWRPNDTFVAWEQALFSANVVGDLQPVSAINRVVFWSNPVQSGLANLEMSSFSDLGRVKLVFVDRHGVTLAASQYTTTGSGANMALDLLSTGGLLNNEHYRLYYQALAPDSTVVLQGHGDFQMNN